PEECNLPRRGGRNLCCPSTLPPGNKCLLTKMEDLPIPMHPHPRFHQPTKEPTPHHPICHWRHQTPKRTDHIRLDQQPIAPAYPPCRGQMLFPCDHQAGEIERILMRRSVRTVVVAEFTVVALIDNPMVVGGRELGDVSFIAVDAVEQGVERRTQIEAAPATISEITVVALIDNPMVVGGRELGDVSFIAVDAVEQGVERRTQIEAAPATIA